MLTGRALDREAALQERGREQRAIARLLARTCARFFGRRVRPPQARTVAGANKKHVFVTPPSLSRQGPAVGCFKNTLLRPRWMILHDPRRLRGRAATTKTRFRLHGPARARTVCPRSAVAAAGAARELRLFRHQIKVQNKRPPCV